MHSKIMTVMILSLLFFSSFYIFHFVDISHASEKSVTLCYVNDDAPPEWYDETHVRTIQEGINNVSVGGTVYVYNGTYYENILIDKNLTLTGENKQDTIIDGGGNGHVVHVYKAEKKWIECTVSGFTIRNAGGTGNDCIAFRYVNNGDIYNNKILNSEDSDGIQLDHCTGITINDNQIANNAGAGISLIRSEYNNIHGNVIQNNQKGLYVYDLSSSNNIHSNTITGNSQYGIHIQVSYYQSQNNIFYQNDFTNNGQNAYDSGTNNWDDGEQGNYWDDYDGTDENPQDGIGDTPYEIPGGGNNQDRYPLGYFQTNNEKPIATILSITPTTIYYGESITFHGMGDDPDGFIVTYEWRSSINGYLSGEQSFSTSDLKIGTHIIYFRVQDNDGDWSLSKTAQVVVNPSPNQKPLAFISSITPQQTTYGEKIYFYGYGTDEDGTIVEYKWISSIDGVIGTQSYFNKSDLSVGTHIISFQVMDDDNSWSDRVNETVIVSSSSSSNQYPIADAGGPYFGQINTTITFNGMQSYDTDGLIVSYIWDFGDESTESGATVEHIYTGTGNYTVTLQVTDNDGFKATQSTFAIITQSGDSSGQNGSNAGKSSSGPFDFGIDIPLQIIAPIIGIVAFLAIIGLFFFWIRRS